MAPPILEGKIMKTISTVEAQVIIEKKSGYPITVRGVQKLAHAGKIKYFIHRGRLELDRKSVENYKRVGPGNRTGKPRTKKT